MSYSSQLEHNSYVGECEKTCFVRSPNNNNNPYLLSSEFSTFTLHLHRTLALLNILRLPFILIPFAIGAFVSGRACAQRITKYLKAPELPLDNDLMSNGSDPDVVYVVLSFISDNLFIKSNT